MARILTLLVLSTFMFLGSLSAGYALGIQNHTVNGVYHGCNDSGCINSSDDYARQGFTSLGFSTFGDEVWTSIHRVGTGQQLNYQLCFNCTGNSVSYDVNPTKECEFFTHHYVEDGGTYLLNAHQHYTARDPGC